MCRIFCQQSVPVLLLNSITITRFLSILRPPPPVTTASLIPVLFLFTTHVGLSSVCSSDRNVPIPGRVCLQCLALQILFGYFYCAMLRIARTMLSQNVCLSVRPSVYLFVTRQYSVRTAKHILKLFPSSGGHTILVCLYQIWQYSDGNHH